MINDYHDYNVISWIIRDDISNKIIYLEKIVRYCTVSLCIYVFFNFKNYRMQTTQTVCGISINVVNT